MQGHKLDWNYLGKGWIGRKITSGERIVRTGCSGMSMADGWN